MSNFNNDHTLFQPSMETRQPKKRLRKYIDVVDGYNSLNSWCPNTVTGDDSGNVDQCGLRLHQDWICGDLVPSLPESQQQSQEKPPKMAKEPIKIRIKFPKKPQNESSKFKKGEIVEVSSDNEGYKGVWFVATIVDIIEKERLFLVEYRDLMTNDGSQLLIEEIDTRFIRPCPPQVPFCGSFKRLQEVDAWYNDGWWKGMVIELVNSKECFVRFMYNEVLKFESSKLRPHQDWIDGKWVMSTKESSEQVKKFGTKLISKCPIPRTTITGSKFGLQFYKGERIEVKSDEKGFEGSWYTATIVDFLQNGKYLVEYLTLKTDDLTEQLKEEADASDIRPYPPDIDHFCRFMLRERVDVWYNDGWWEGLVSSVLHGFKYKVFFCTTNEELEFEHYHMRPHQEWIDGRWMLASLV